MMERVIILPGKDPGQVSQRMGHNWFSKGGLEKEITAIGTIKKLWQEGVELVGNKFKVAHWTCGTER